MRIINVNEFKELTQSIADIYDVEMTEIKDQIWWDLLKPYTIKQFEIGLRLHMSCPDSGHETPTVAHIIKKMHSFIFPSDDKIHLDAVDAWLNDIKAIKTDSELSEESERIIKLIGGREDIKTLTGMDLQLAREDFIDCYCVIKREERREDEQKLTRSADLFTP